MTKSYKQACDEVLLSRAKSSSNSVCVGGEEVDGVYKKYTSEYLRWNLQAMWTKVTIHMTDKEREDWFINNPPPEDKFEEK